MEALLPTLKDEELLRDFKEVPSLSVKRTALTELQKRGHAEAPKLAREVLEFIDAPATFRAFAARIVAGYEGPKAADDFIDLAQKRDVTQQLLRDTLADLLAEMKDEKVDKKLMNLVGKGKPHERAFALRATKLIQDEKLADKVRKGLKEKDPEILAATLVAIAARKDREALPELEKLLEKSKEPTFTEALLETMSALYSGENTWVERLKGFADSSDLVVRNAAIYELGRLERRNLTEFFVSKLSDGNWSTRYAAVRALEALRTREAIAALVARLPQETGRMELLITDTLWRLTGKPFGRRTPAWVSWWQNEGAEFQPISPAELEKLQEEAEERRLRQVTSAAEFFGIRIESHRVIFIIDVSGSMVEPLRARYEGEQGETRIDVAKRELKKAIEGLDPKALFNILPFSGGGRPLARRGDRHCDERHAGRSPPVRRSARGDGGDEHLRRAGTRVPGPGCRHDRLPVGRRADRGPGDRRRADPRGRARVERHTRHQDRHGRGGGLAAAPAVARRGQRRAVRRVQLTPKSEAWHRSAVPATALRCRTSRWLRNAPSAPGPTREQSARIGADRGRDRMNVRGTALR
jgi:hypothetical protein